MPDIPISEGVSTLASLSDGDNLYILGGGAAITTSVDKSGFTTGVVVCEVGRAYTGQFATAASPFYAEITERLVYAAAAGAMYWRGKDSGDATPLVQVIGGGHFYFVDGTATRLEAVSGQVTVAAGAIGTNIRLAGGAVTILDDSSTDPTLLHLMAGPGGQGATCYTERGGTTFTNDAGSLSIVAGSNAITTLNCYGSSAMARTLLRQSGTITTLNAIGHIPDTTQLTSPLTITNTNVNMSLPGAQALLQNPLINFTNTPTEYITDGRLV